MKNNLYTSLHLKNVLLLAWIALASVLWGQSESASIKDKITYTYQNGYKISELYYLEYDKAGMLWLVGESSHAKDFQLLKRDFIIQRYDGFSFHDFVLPIQKEQKGKIELVERKDGILFIRFYNKSINILYKVNPITLEVLEVTSFDKIVGLSRDNQMYPFKEGILFFVKQDAGTDIFSYMRDEKFRHLNTLDNKGENSLHFSHMQEFEDHFLLNEDRTGILSISNDGQLLRTNKLALEDNSTIKGRIHLKNCIHYNDEIYIILDKDGYYQYDKKRKKLSKRNELFGIQSSHIESTYSDTYNNLVIIQSDNDEYLIRRVLSTESSEYTDEIKLEKVHKVASRDISKELVVATSAKLEHYFFNQSKIKTYLEDYSIRGIYQKETNLFIVATARNGWFEINTENNKSKRLHFNSPKPAAPLNENRGIFKTTDGYFSNNPNGIVHINPNTKKTTSYVYYPVEEMIEDDTHIYYGTLWHKLMKFDKIRRSNIPLADTDTLQIMGLKLHNDKLYCATDKGILIYADSVAVLRKITGMETAENNFISVYVDDYYGVLVGSRSGRVYQFDEESDSFKELYADKLNASIATILVDDQHNLWLNTFAGIVSYNPSTQKEIRYSKKDGLSHYECNRYSAQKTSDGRFLVGTVRGLNIFRPNQLSKTKIVGKPSFLAISYFDEASNQWIKETSPERTKKLKQISLPASQRRIVLQVGMLGTANNHQLNFKYRLSQEGNPSQWNELTNKNQISLSNLAPGKYNLSVKVYSPIQGDIGEVLELSIRSKPFFHETWWFKTLVVLGGLFLVLYYIKQSTEKQKFHAQLTQNLIIGQEKERARLSRDIHDGIGQQLILLIRKSQSSRQTEIQSIAHEVLNEVRSITKNLHPSILDRLGITETLHQLINGLDEHTPLFFTVDIDPIDNILSKPKELHLYRFVQEILNNIIKHADAKSVSFELLKHEQDLLLTITDNGKGFDVKDQLTTKYSLGIKTLYERIKILNGKLDIKSEESTGTKISVTIPIGKNSKWYENFSIFNNNNEK